jgi:hypothetical protein
VLEYLFVGRRLLVFISAVCVSDTRTKRGGWGLGGRDKNVAVHVRLRVCSGPR